MRVLVVVGVVLGLAVAVVTVMSVGVAVYPGAMKWTAPMLCPDGQPDAYVVRTQVTDSEGTSTSFTLFCMGRRGDFTEVGSWRPLGLLFVMVYAACLALLAAALALVRIRRR